MKDQVKTRAELVDELGKVRRQMAGSETRRRQAEEALRLRTADLQAAHEKLTTFTHALANDLRGPLGLIVSFAQLLEQDYGALSDDELRRYLRTIAQRGREMVGVIDGLLAVRSAPLKEIAEEIGPLDMSAILSEVLDRLAFLIEENGAEIVLPENLPLALGHGPWVEEVWANLVSNAIRYGGRPPRVVVGATDQDDGSVRFWVQDNGPGLAPEKQVQLFTQDDRVQFTDIGMGLAVVRRIVEKLDGRVGVESEVGQGSLFFFTVPATE
jgi:two-component system sensor histidine kinase/response regulator